MKNKYILLALMGTMFSFTACEKDMDSYDFSNSLAPYVEIKGNDNAVTAVEGTNAAITVQLREAFQEPVTVQYEVTGAFTASGSATIPRNSFSVSIPISVPANLVSSATGTAEATFVLKSAAKGDTNLTVGLTGAEAETIKIKIVPTLAGLSSAKGTVSESNASVIEIPITFTSALRSDATINYTLTPAAGNTANNVELVSANPLQVASGATKATIKVKVKDNLAINENNVYNLVVNSITTAAGAEVYLNSKKVNYTLTVVDDVREVNFNSETPVTVAAGIKNLEVAIDEPSTEPVTVNYSVTGGVAGVVTSGSVVIYSGARIANINLNLPSVAYGADKKLTVKIDSISSEDKEVKLGDNNEIELVLE